ncbi:MAG: hypothetical protein J6Y30_01215 [Treponema sp.]|nr:hypothetical protein [Treponema sp.]
MKQKNYIITSLILAIFFTACKSTETYTDYINIKEQPSAIIHIIDDSSDSDYKLSKVNNIKIEKLKTGSDAIKIHSGKAFTLHFSKPVQVQIQVLQVKLPLLKKMIIHIHGQ